MTIVAPGRRVIVPTPGVRVIQPRGVAAPPAKWWDPNGDIVCANIWAYRAINTPGTPWPGGPTNYAETLVNLVTPGVNDLVEGPVPGVPIPWNVLTGWGFIEAVLQHFNTGIVPVLNPVVWTMLVQYAGLASVGAGTVIGVYDVAIGNAFLFQKAAATMRAYNSGFRDNAPNLVTGNYGVAAKIPYRNGAAEPLVIGAGVGVCTRPIFVGALNLNGVAAQHVTADIESVWIADCTITPVQVLAVATAQSQL